MNSRFLLAALAAAAFAIPVSANMGADKTSKSSSADGGAEAMFKSLDKNGDGFLSKEETMGTPHHDQFTQLDTNGDGKLSRAEHAAAPEHAHAKSAADSTPGSPNSDTTKAADEKKKY
jgi:hypothetical protein